LHFGLSEEQELLQQTVRGFIAGECPPQRVRELFDDGAGYDAAIWTGMAEMGLSGLVIPETYGGAGLELLDLALVSEVAGAEALPSPLLGHSLACMALADGGSPEQKRCWLPKLASGELIGTVALGEELGEELREEKGAWEPETWTLSERDGLLHGSKAYVPHASQAGLLVIGIAGGGLAIVETATADGVRREDQAGIDRGRPIGRLHFEATPCERLPGGLGSARLLLDAGRAALAADSHGAATRLIEMSAAYAKDRKQFGFPIAQFQAVKHQIARIGTDIEPTRALFWYAAHALDQKYQDASRAAAMAKAHITDRAMHAAREAVELHGGLGFTWECDVQIWFKRAMFNRAFLGSPEALRERCAELAGW
jgi:alkylation response protein AidB-like acyl-CoA dehydrogenase